MKHLGRVVLISGAMICIGAYAAFAAPEGESLKGNTQIELPSSLDAGSSDAGAEGGFFSTESTNRSDSALMLLSGAGLIGVAQVVRRTRKAT